MQIPEVIKEHPYYVIGGAAVGLYLITRFIGGSSSSSTQTVDYGTGSGIATGSPYSSGSDTTSADVANQIATAQQATMAQVGQMLQGYQDQETQNLQSITGSFSSALSNMQAQTQQMQQTLTQQEQQDQATNASNLTALSNSFTQALQQMQSQNTQAIQQAMNASQTSNANQLSGLQSVIQSIGQSLSNLTNKVNSAPTPTVGTYSPIPSTPGVSQQTTVTHTFFGSDVDIASAISVYGGQQGYNFVDTQNLTPSQITSMVSAAGSGAVIVGGEKSEGGVTNQEVAGLPVVRIGGQTAQDTKTLLQNAHF